MRVLFAFNFPMFIITPVDNDPCLYIFQRWATIRRRQPNLLADSGNKSVSSTQSEERLAAQKAFSLAIDMPMTGSLSAIQSGFSMDSFIHIF